MDTLHDEVQDAYEETFNHITLGLMLIGLATGLAALAITGPLSLWFGRAVALALVGGGVYTLRMFGKATLASYLLVAGLLGLLAEMLFLPGAFSGFIPYLLLPAVLIIGLLFNPWITLSVTFGSLLLIILLLALSGQWTLPNLQALLPPFALTVLTALLAAGNKKYLLKLGERLRENRKLLRDRTRTIIETRRSFEAAQQQMIMLQQELAQISAELSQAQLQASQGGEQLYELSRSVVRELNQVVNRLEQKLEQMVELPGPQSQSEALDAIWQKIYYLKGFMVNLEQMLQAEYGEIKLVYQAINAGRLICEVAGTAQGLVRHKPVEVRCQTPEDLPLLQADPDRLRQALLQLVANAASYTQKGLIELQAEVVGDQLRILVSDTGAGIPGEDIELIFEKFGRSRRSSEQSQGAGLGLALAKRLIERHGGRIWVSSIVGVGSTFYVALPLAPTPDIVSPRPVSAGIAPRLVRPRVSSVPSVPSVSPVPSVQPTPAPRRVDREGPAETAPEPAPSLAAASSSENTDQTRVSMRPVHRVRMASAEPVRRFGQVYTRRLILLALALLLILGAMVTMLAMINGPVDQQISKELDEAVALAAATATQLAADNLALNPEVTPASTFTVQAANPTRAASAAPQPAATLTQAPANSPTPSPTATAPLPSATPTATPSPAATPSPLPGLSVSPAATAANSRETTRTVTTPGFSPSSTPVDAASSSPVRLSYQSGQADDYITANGLAVKMSQNSRLSWSPAGALLFSGEQENERDIYLVSSEGGQPANLTAAAGDDIQPAWSPDGRRIAFSSGRSGNLDIYIMEADGAQPIPLTQSRGFDEWPAWSPDGEKIAFVSDRDGNVELYTMNVDGGNLQRLTDHPADDWPASWSPDGQWLVFASNRDENWDLYLVSADGGPAFRLTNSPAAEREPVWSPDGTAIAFSHSGGGSWDIYTLPAPTDNLGEVPPSAWTQITQTPTDERYPSWRPAAGFNNLP